jgi:hypothetical protein
VLGAGDLDALVPEITLLLKAHLPKGAS